MSSDRRERGINSLASKLNGVLAALQAGDAAGACAGFNAFSNEVQAQSGKKNSGRSTGHVIIDATIQVQYIYSVNIVGSDFFEPCKS